MTKHRVVLGFFFALSLHGLTNVASAQGANPVKTEPVAFVYRLVPSGGGVFNGFFQVFPDGTAVEGEFVVPAGKTLVITDIEGSHAQDPTNNPRNFVLSVQLRAGTGDFQVLWSRRVRFALMQNIAFADFLESLISGIRIGEGLNVRLQLSAYDIDDIGGLVWIRGYLERNIPASR